MGFYIRESVNFGWVKFNASQSGIGASVGVHGMHAKPGARGNYVYMGMDGIAYNAVFEGERQRHAPKPKTKAKREDRYTRRARAYMEMINPDKVVPVTEAKAQFATVPSHDAYIVASSAQEIIDEINARRRKIWIWPFAILLMLIPAVGWILGPIIAFLVYALVDKKRKTTTVVYDITPDAELRMQAFYDALAELVACDKKWCITSETTTTDLKHNAGSSRVVERVSIVVKNQLPKHVRSNVLTPMIPLGGRMVYFFPDRVLILAGKNMRSLSYADLRLEQQNKPFVEKDPMPRDGAVVEWTWQYVNKSGGPDKRRNDNPKLPVMLYNDIVVSGDAGLYERAQFSRPNAAVNLVKQLYAYQRGAFLRIYRERDVQEMGEEIQNLESAMQHMADALDTPEYTDEAAYRDNDAAVELGYNPSPILTVDPIID